MMKIEKYILILFIAIASFSCSEKELNLYDGDAYLQFGPAPGEIYDQSKRLNDTLRNFTFVYEDASVNEKDVKFNLYVVGGSKEYDRPFVIEQVLVDDANNAVPGTNYKAFSSEEIKKEYVIKSGQAYLEIPIRIMRPAEGDENVYTLKFKIVSNEHFSLGEADCLYRTLTFTSDLVRPSFWTDRIEKWYAPQKYSKTKHKFMIEVTGLRWDDETWSSLYSAHTLNLYYYYIDMLKKELNKINNERAAQGLGPWLDEDGDEIKFK